MAITHKKWFLAGVMQGSTHATTTMGTVSSQDYRTLLTSIIKEVDPTGTIYDPWVYHDKFLTEKGKSVTINDLITGAKEDPWSDDLIRQFIKYNLEHVRASTFLVAYLPTASMGTAVEMNEAYNFGVPVYTISHLTSNWTIKMCSTKIFPDVETFVSYLKEKFKL